MAPKTTLLALLPLLSPAIAWGTLGHTTVALIAQSLVSNKTASFAKSLLNDTSPLYLFNIATWADSYRYTAEGAFSSPLHYIDAFDDPPTSCNVDYKRDCPEEGCIVSAIANYTTRIAAANVSRAEQEKALKWVVHFVGDIHQPLHVENLAVGGNGINVTFGGVVKNLHSVWDSSIAEKLVGGYTVDYARNWSTALVGEIEGGKYANVSRFWAEGMDVTDPVASAMVWARDSNAKVCTTVLPDGQAGVEGKELSGAYYENAAPVVEAQVAKAGFRLAKWLDRIVQSAGKGYTTKEVKEEWVKRGGVQLEDWMVEARRKRRECGWECGCAEGVEGHVH
ncbi:hypothetical protein BU23DRAFT_94690 [Bimuria novae-zelandiae CBS 107.79]|uniref:Nuclease PA3 n=1 Tax=Bimuria novae-zelandiae CBS 107.79 TaxID=1447943 RepID=A0A6A5VEX9_9PLEO|nr:hypothetical protein BU23DRAFT_94690 [Bimuria novae-zelandiae CBS 107.79]